MREKKKQEMKSHHKYRIKPIVCLEYKEALVRRETCDTDYNKQGRYVMTYKQAIEK